MGSESLLGTEIAKLDLNRSKKKVGNLPLPLEALYAAMIAQKDHPVLLICKDTASLRQLADYIGYWDRTLKLRLFPDWETLPYDQLSPHRDIISERLELLSALPNFKRGIVLTTVAAVMPRISPMDFIKSRSFIIKKGEIRDLAQMREDLIARGYLNVQRVLSHGEFAVRGSIIDLYPMGHVLPLRIDFLDDEVDSIRTFDPESQRSLETIEGIKLLPAHEFPLDETGIAAFRSNYRDAFPGVNLAAHPIYQAISRGAIPAGIEYYLPLFFVGCSSFFDYLEDRFNLIICDGVLSGAEDFLKEAYRRSHEYAGLSDHPPLPPQRLFLTLDEFTDKLNKMPQLALSQKAFDESEIKARGIYNAPLESIPVIAIDRHAKDPSAAFAAFATDYIRRGGRILITAPSEGRRQSLRDLLPHVLTSSFGIRAASSFDDFMATSDPLMLTIAPFVEGFCSEADRICVLTENELLGFKAQYERRRRTQSQQSQDALIRNLSQLEDGQVVVHVDHGIGLYRGLRTLTINGITGEFLTIEYRDGDKLNIPITSLSKIARYSGAENPALSKLGSDNWEKKKLKAQQKVRDVAAELLDLYASRASRQGRAFEIDRHALEEFAAGFGYETTADQQQAIDATLADLEQKKPMDRLVCGDVGFGKTEVALRAAFVVASAGRQVALLVPTTILAEQHYQNFQERFAGTALTVEVLSRFKSAAQQKEAVKRLEAGTIDIIIGTHKLLGREIKFKDLGLVIIDEEHRFGVRQKERLKQLRAEVDLLTLTATPIPRTLNMAMEGIRELSLIATAPEHRLAVKTFVSERSDQLCREAIMRELRRGGQLYYLHNDVSTIEQRREQLQKLVPEAKIEIGHGQMGEHELQKVMRDFYRQRFNLLLCSTIIENGLDVPTANTVIIDRADLLGLAQLHQIRGRVGRSHHQAYAYLFTPPTKLLSKDAKRRLDAIASLEDLGAGFVLANHDLEIRGAGEILGEEQSGQIEAVGFSLYTEMLACAVKALKEGREPSLTELSLQECEIDLHLSSLFPETYISDINTRLSFYKRLSSCQSPEQFEDLKIECIDRFGLLPQGAVNLFEISYLKYLADRLGIRRIYGDEAGGVIELSPHHKIDPDYLLELVLTTRNNSYRMAGPSALRYNIKEDEERSRLAILKQLLLALGAHPAKK